MIRADPGQPHHFGGALGGDRLENRRHPVAQAGDNSAQPAQHQHANNCDFLRLLKSSLGAVRSRLFRSGGLVGVDLDAGAHRRREGDLAEVAALGALGLSRSTSSSAAE